MYKFAYVTNDLFKLLCNLKIRINKFVFLYSCNIVLRF